MGILTADMQRVVGEQRLGFHATVAADGSPNLSPKGTTAIWDDDHLFFADICSPNTVANLRSRPAIEVNVVDPFVRKGYRFKGTATVHDRGSVVYEQGLAKLAKLGLAAQRERIDAIVLIRVEQAQSLISPAYDDGKPEAAVFAAWAAHYESLHARRRTRDDRDSLIRLPE
jgi:predicted pyridoxine 5'-phosphate oxidase superfamily flavin-nucleotide-binding protein